MGFLSSIFSSFSGPPTREKFAQLMLNAMRKADPANKYELHSEEFYIHIVGTDGKGFLHNLYIEYNQLDSKDRGKFIQDMARMLVGIRDPKTPETLEEVRDHLMPKVWSNWLGESLKLRARLDGKKGYDSPSCEMGDHLAGGIVLDSKNAMQSVGAEDLEKWGINFYEAMEIAKENLAKLPTSYAKIGDALYGVLSQDAYESSRVFDLDWIRGLEVSGDPIAIAPSRNYLLVTGTENRDLWEPFFDLAYKSYQEDPRPLSMMPIRLVDDYWEDWLPPPDHPLRSKFENVVLLDLANMYSEQKKLFEEFQERKELTDAFISSVMGFENKASGEITTMSIWVKDLKTWLPRTHKIAFMEEPNGAPQMASWEEVQRVVGDQMRQIDGIYPPRWEIEGFPTPAQFASLTLT
jgi:hypothetical protein